jgi:pimeloyl-ACP methyl ester carboxylesterase
MAHDVREVLRSDLGIQEPVGVVGHDIGLMIAYAYAQAFQEDVTHLVVIDAPLPGTAVFDCLRSDPRVWHFAFHAARDVPEMLVAGREREYLRAFFNARIGDPSAITETDLNEYVAAYSAAGAMRAGFELYRTFDRDANDNRTALARHGKLRIPVLAIGGAMSTSGPLMEAMMKEVASNVRGCVFQGTAHWIPEECPSALTEKLATFFRAAGALATTAGA